MKLRAHLWARESASVPGAASSQRIGLPRRDAIVNAANSALLPGGVDGAIRRKARREIDEDLYRIGHCAEGEAVITPGYRLPAYWVIHTVTAVWAGDAQWGDQKQTLGRCYTNVLKLADARRLRTIACPSIGTGAYGWPTDIATQIAFKSVVDHLRHSEVQSCVTFCCFASEDRERYSGLIAGLRS